MSPINEINHYQWHSPEKSDDHDLDVKVEMNDIWSETSCISLNFPIETLMEEIKSVVKQKHESEIRDDEYWKHFSGNLDNQASKAKIKTIDFPL